MQRSYNGARRLVTARRTLYPSSSQRHQSTSSTTTPSSNGSSNQKAPSRRRPSGKHTVSILERLFPQELGAERRTSVDRAAAREVPIYRLDDGINNDSSTSSAGTGGYKQLKTERGRMRAHLDARVSASEQGQRIGVLKVQGGSNTLSDSDFRRLAPSGQHIDGWTVQGSLLEVIPIRSPHTLRRTSSYYLIFRNWHSANSYRSHISSLHTIANAPTRAQADSTSYDGYGPTFFHQSASYAAMPPGAHLQTQLMPANEFPDVFSVYAHAGWSAILESRRSPYEVLLWTDLKVSPHAIFRAIERDGAERRMPWALLEPDTKDLSDARLGTDIRFQTCMRQITVARAEHHFLKLVSTKPRSTNQNPERYLDRGAEQYPERVGNNTEHHRGTEKNSSQHPERAEKNKRYYPIPKAADQLKKFILSFKDEGDARRFAFAWHRRDIFQLLESVNVVLPDDEGEVKVHAEVLFE